MIKILSKKILIYLKNINNGDSNSNKIMKLGMNFFRN